MTYNDPAQFCTVFMAEANPMTEAVYTVTVPATLAGKIRVEAEDLPDGASLDSRILKNGDVYYSVALTNRPHLNEETANQSVT